jgi:hypothetical protein
MFGSWFRHIPNDRIGIVIRRPLLARVHPDDHFRVRIHGSPGPQANILKANSKTYLPTPLYSVRRVPRTEVPAGTIAVVWAKCGAVPPPGRSLANHVECDNFQDGETFLRNGGEMGWQPGVLVGGTYDVNPELFDVVTVISVGTGRSGLNSEQLKEIRIPQGMTGVVIVLQGEPLDPDSEVAPEVPGHDSFHRPWEFHANGGRRGAQAQTLGSGAGYQINPLFARVVLIPTRELILEWTARENKSSGNYDASLEPIIINVSGHRLKCEMSQTIRIPAKSAPRLVGRFGEQDAAGPSEQFTGVLPVQRFVERVLGRTVEMYFHTIAAEYSVMDFLTNQSSVCGTLEDHVRGALAELNVEAVRTTLNQFEPESVHLDRARQQEAVLEQWKVNKAIEAQITGIDIESDRHRRAAEEATLEARLKLLGADQVKRERLIAELAKMHVPSVIAGGDPGALLQYLPLQVARDLISRIEGSAPALQGSRPGELLPGVEPGQDGHQAPTASREGTRRDSATQDGHVAGWKPLRSRDSRQGPESEC